MCREKIPPSKEMVTQLKYWRERKSCYEAEGDISSPHYTTAKSVIERLEHEIGEWTESIDYNDDNNKYLVLPLGMYEAAKVNNIQKILNWLGPLPVDKQRVNARNPEKVDTTLLHCAALNNNSDLLSILLQLGAEVDPVDASGDTPLGMCYKPEYYAQARLLLEWGAEISNSATQSKDDFIAMALRNGNSKLANIVKSEFGGRWCEIINLPNRPDLIGKTCVVEKFLSNKNRYKVIFEASKEVGLVGPQNLKRRDRTPDDCGYYVTYKNGRSTRHEFSSKEECQAFVASLTEGEKSEGCDAEAEARAEEAAASLLAELDLDLSVDSENKRSKKGKEKGKKKGKK